MTTAKRIFKIDIYDSTVFTFGLYHLESAKGLFGKETWKLVQPFRDREDARQFWEKIKDLPEYLP